MSDHTLSLALHIPCLNVFYQQNLLDVQLYDLINLIIWIGEDLKRTLFGDLYFHALCCRHPFT